MKLNRKGMASIQMILLIGMVFAVSYMIYSADYVEAATISTPSVCCEKTTEGAFCINTQEENCAEGFKSSPTSCEATSYCKLGTCYDSSEGICMENTPQRVCEVEGGTWDPREVEEVPQCQLGCCIISDQAAFVPLVRCKKLSGFFGVDVNYRPEIGSELECVVEAQSQDVGACVYGSDFERTCDFTTRDECGANEVVEAVNGSNITLGTEKKFYKDYLCSAEELGTSCGRQASTGCLNGKVYWFDSCGNKENVYSANKEASWNNGRVAEPAEVCPASDGSNVDCGNCDYLLGTRCEEWDGLLGIGKPSGSDHFCQRTECVDRYGNERKNGESWCVYDAGTTEGKDPVGSRQYKEVCVDGEVKVEPCADFRNEICIEGATETSDGEFGNAACRVNRWQDCLAQKDEGDCLNEDRRDCMWLPPVTGLTVGGEGSLGGKTFSNPQEGGQTFSNPATNENDATNPITGNAIFGGDEGEDEELETTTNRGGGVCVPDIPPGFNFWDDNEARGNCGQVSSKCIVKFEESTLGGKKCIENCECLEEDWAVAMNSVCKAVGDCGGYVNYADEYTEDGYEWIDDGAKKKFSPNEVNKLKIEADSPGKSKNMAWAVVGGLGATSLLAGAGLFGAGAGASGGSIMPNIAKGFSAFGKNLPGLGEALPGLGINNNWIAAGAFNALAIGGIVWIGAKAFGADSNTAAALGGATMAGLFAGEIVTNNIASVIAEEAIQQATKDAITKAGTEALTKQITEAGVKKLGEEAAKTAIQQAGIDVVGQEAISAAGQNAIGQQAVSASPYLGLTNIGVSIGIGVLVYFLLKKDYSEEIVEFKCLQWQAPTGGDDCEICNDEDLACSEYRCRSLGQNCELVNEGTEDEKCVNVNPNDVEPPVISPNEEDLTFGYEYTDVKNSPPGPGFRIVPTDGECVKAFTPLEFGVKTDEPAQCKIDFNHTGSFEEMSFWMGGSNLYTYNHSEQFSLPGADDVEGIVLENGKDWTFYIRCSDRNGNENSAEYAVRFCTEDGPDVTAPQIKATSVINGGCVAADTDTANVEFYVDEPAQCRWSFEDQDYDNMQNDMSCVSETYQINSLQLYTCSADLTGIARDGTNYYVRCKDQPGVEENDRNENADSYEFTLRGSTDLKIMNLMPNGTIFGGVNPAPVELYAETRFGCDDGRAICYYSTTGEDADYLQFFDTNTDDGIHTQRQDLTEGRYKYFYKCVDSGGNVAKESTTFNLDIDVNSPVIARIYEEDQMLKIVTVRNSECVYTHDNCDYSFVEGIEMPYANSSVHVTEWKEDKTYYIKCRDEFKNEEADCSAIVKPTTNFL